MTMAMTMGVGLRSILIPTHHFLSFSNREIFLPFSRLHGLNKPASQGRIGFFGMIDRLIWRTFLVRAACSFIVTFHSTPVFDSGILDSLSTSPMIEMHHRWHFPLYYCPISSGGLLDSLGLAVSHFFLPRTLTSNVLVYQN